MERYDGSEGFFLINAINGGADVSINKIVEFSSEHILRPYGDNPQITSLKICGQEARLISSSSSQSEPFNQKAELIVKYPKPVLIKDNLYHFFVLVADESHIIDISKTIKFNNVEK